MVKQTKETQEEENKFDTFQLESKGECRWLKNKIHSWAYKKARSYHEVKFLFIAENQETKPVVIKLILELLSSYLGSGRKSIYFFEPCLAYR